MPGPEPKAVNIDRLFPDNSVIVMKAGTPQPGDPLFDEGYAET
jgi:hypothetical protein